MKHLLIIALCLLSSAGVFAQNAGDEPPSKDDVILYLRTMRSHDMMQRMMEVQGQSMQNLFRDIIVREKRPGSCGIRHSIQEGHGRVD